MGWERGPGRWLGCVGVLIAGASCGGGPDFERHVTILGNGPFTVNFSSLWADRGADTRITLNNAASDVTVVHDFILTDPTDGHVVAEILGVPAGESKSVRFTVPYPPGADPTRYPFHCGQPGHDDGGYLDVPTAPARGRVQSP
jgi:hypothetical protein